LAKHNKLDGETAEAAKPSSVIPSLKPGEADSVLKLLLAAHPELCAEAEDLAQSVLGEVSFESVAEDVACALQLLDMDDLNDRAGSHWGEYTEPTEAAWELMEEEIEPHLEDIIRYRALGLDGKALEIAKGVVLGLYSLRDESDNDVLGWSPDFLPEGASEAVVVWYTGSRYRDSGNKSTPCGLPFPKDFVEQFVPEWASLIERTIAQAARRSDQGRQP
jgi:hypothetical protein